MAALRGTLHGMRGEVSRLGSAKSGMMATLNTWERKVTVHLAADGTGWVKIESYSGRGTATMYQLLAGGGAGKLMLLAEGRDAAEAKKPAECCSLCEGTGYSGYERNKYGEALRAKECGACGGNGIEKAEG